MNDNSLIKIREQYENETQIAYIDYLKSVVNDANVALANLNNNHVVKDKEIASLKNEVNVLRNEIDSNKSLEAKIFDLETTIKNNELKNQELIDKVVELLARNDEIDKNLNKIVNLDNIQGDLREKQEIESEINDVHSEVQSELRANQVVNSQIDNVAVQTPEPAFNAGLPTIDSITPTQDNDEQTIAPDVNVFNAAIDNQVENVASDGEEKVVSSEEAPQELVQNAIQNQNEEKKAYTSAGINSNASTIVAFNKEEAERAKDLFSMQSQTAENVTIPQNKADTLAAKVQKVIDEEQSEIKTR